MHVPNYMYMDIHICIYVYTLLNKYFQTAGAVKLHTEMCYKEQSASSHKEQLARKYINTIKQTD